MLRSGIEPEVVARDLMTPPRFLGGVFDSFLLKLPAAVVKAAISALPSDLSQSLEKVSEEFCRRRRKGDSCQQKKLLTCSAGFF